GVAFAVAFFAAAPRFAVGRVGVTAARPPRRPAAFVGAAGAFTGVLVVRAPALPRAGCFAAAAPPARRARSGGGTATPAFLARPPRIARSGCFAAGALRAPRRAATAAAAPWIATRRGPGRAFTGGFGAGRSAASARRPR